MTKTNVIQQQDIKEFADSFELSDIFENSSFLITGATGLIGSALVKCLVALHSDIKITIPVRNKEKALHIFANIIARIEIIECELTKWVSTLDRHFDYVVHCASPTAGEYIVKHPVETYCLALDSTRALLDYSNRVVVKSMVYVSSLEYYGQILNEKNITENVQGYVDSTSPRSSYPMGKRAAEYLCVAYAAEYNTPIKIARLTQTFGAGVSKDDNRVFAQFARSVINGTDIVLHTKGESAKPYCYTTDSVSAILYLLVKGKNGDAYNVANEDTYISIKDMAQLLCNEFNQNINVRMEFHPDMGYAPETKLRLDVSKMEALGWKPKHSLIEMFGKLIESMK